MTYYEELGISADAAEEDIRQAHRRLVKLLHPDQHSNDELRRMAELQMMRVNSLVEQLLDPTQRKLYDLAIRAPLPSYVPPSPSVKRGILPNEAIQQGWKYALAGVALATVAWVMTATSPTDVVRSVTTGVLSVTSVAASEPPPPQKAANASRAIPRAPIVLRQTPPVPIQSPQPSLDPVPDSKPQENTPAPALIHTATPTPDPSPRPQVKAADSIPLALAGTWLYAGGKRTAEDERLYKPEYIELRIQEEGGTLHGEYRSRYAVTDLPISPTVNFSFQGVFAGSASLPWKGPKGSSGTVVLKLLHRNAMQVDWKMTEAGDSGIGLEFGTAILVRRL